MRTPDFKKIGTRWW